jgi:hypothetical protein
MAKYEPDSLVDLPSKLERSHYQVLTFIVATTVLGGKMHRIRDSYPFHPNSSCFAMAVPVQFRADSAAGKASIAARIAEGVRGMRRSITPVPGYRAKAD